MKTMIRRTGFSAAGALKTVTAVMLAALLVLLPFLGGDAPA